MMHCKPLTSSEKYARQLLAAWHEQNDVAFIAKSQLAPTLGQDAASSGEQERIDLIQDLAQNLVNCKSADKNEELNAALQIIRQLARCDDQAVKQSRIPQSGKLACRQSSQHAL